MENSFDNLTLSSVPNQSIQSNATATTVLNSQFIDNEYNPVGGGITKPLWDASTAPYRHPSNDLFGREQTTKLVSTSFPNMTPAKNHNANIQDEEEKHGTKSLSTSLRIVVVGDIHEEWELLSDSKALEFLRPDLVLFTGDFGNENVEIVRSVASINMPKAAILGNHDSWGTSKFSKKIKDGVQLQLESLGEQHVGYSNLDLPAFKLSVVGGRPFSLGGDNLFRQKLIKSR